MALEMPPVSPQLKRIADELIHATEDSAIPEPVMNAFLPESLKIGPFTLQPVNFAALMLLHSAESPFVTGKPVTSESLLMDVATAVYLLSTHWKTAREAVSRGEVGERIWETAAQLPAMHPEEFQSVVSDIAKHVNKGFATAMSMEAPGGDHSGAQKKTQASDGGSSH